MRGIRIKVAAIWLYGYVGETYAYERGERTVIPIRWTEATRTLEIGSRQGAFPAMQQQRQLRVVVIGDGNGAGAAIPYSGKSVAKVLA